MVRKRSRNSKKHYESDDNDTDSDYALDDSPAEPAPKKYSLRQRKRSLFLADYEYEDDEDIPAPKPESDDDFDVEREVLISEPPIKENNTIYFNEPESSIPDDELIDFEDIIRADIVVNKNRIDYDNIISKTEIKVQPVDNEPHQYQPVKGKRGRKPKIRPPTEVDSSILEPETDVQDECDDLNDRDYDPHDDLDIENAAASFAYPELQEENDKQGSTEILLLDGPEENNVNTLNSNLECQEDSTEKPVELNPLNDLEIIPIKPQESVIKYNENALQAIKDKYRLEQAEVHLEFKQEVTEEDDDVVFVDDKNSEVIILDD